MRIETSFDCPPAGHAVDTLQSEVHSTTFPQCSPSQQPVPPVRGLYMKKQADKWPTEIRLNKAKSELFVKFDDGTSYSFPAEFLRVMSPSAEVQGHGPGERVTVGGKRGVKITAIEPVGNYAVRLRFDDGHATGLYSWSYLGELWRERERLWSDYVDALEAQGLRREA